MLPRLSWIPVISCMIKTCNENRRETTATEKEDVLTHCADSNPQGQR
jgi:hypothetical protein